MFASLKESLNKPQESGYRDILKFEAGKTYQVRLLPNINDPKSSIFHYFHYSWKSFATGQFVSFVSPQTFGERCPIADESYKIYKNGSPEEKEKGKALFRKENWLINVYVVSDPTNPDNDGKVKIMRYGSQLHKIIMSAIEGDDAAEFGEKIFDLTEKGCNFRIKCEKKSEKGKAEFVEYTASRFLSPSTIEGLEDVEAVYKSVHDLTQVFPIKPTEELKKGLQEHYYGTVSEDAPKKTVKKDGTVRIPVSEDGPAEDDIPMSYKTTEKKVETKPADKPVEKKTETKVTSKANVDDDAIKDLLSGLDDVK